MSNDQAPKETAREMLRAVIAEEIAKEKKSLRKWAVGFVVGIVATSCAIQLVNSHPVLPREQGISNASNVEVKREYPLERIVAITTALMVMADNRVGDQEIDLALEIVGRRQAGQIGNSIQFADNTSQWLNGDITLRYFDQALAYLQTGEEKHIAGLYSEKPFYIKSVSHNKNMTEHKNISRAVFKSIAMIQNDIDSISNKNIYNELQSLTRLWANFTTADDADGTRSSSNFYVARMDLIMRMLKNGQTTGIK